MRTSETYRHHLHIASTTGNPAFGVKGDTKLSDLLRIPERVPFDPMHLLYLGINKSLLNAILKCKSVDLDILSATIDQIKVPHYFRRKPRHFLTEFSLWKAQEHRHFLLYFAPFVLLSVHRNSPSQNSNDLFILYYILSTAVYILYEDNITETDIQAAEICIREFQFRVVHIFGDTVRTITLHSLKHLPEQVRKFGPLHRVSAMLFENLNRQLKESVTGTRGSAASMVYRYLNFQSHSVETCDKSVPSVIGKSLPYKRFKNSFLTFHTFDYGRRMKCASYFAYLSGRQKFVKIKPSGKNASE